jgi:hypothetical protein
MKFPRLRRAVLLWLAFALFLALCWAMSGCSAPDLDAANLECATVGECPCHYDVTYPKVMAPCDLPAGTVCYTSQCDPTGASLTCNNGYGVTLSVTDQEATVTCPGGTETVPVVARYVQ